jgi:hypothetical protein
MRKASYTGKPLPSGEREIDVGWRPSSRPGQKSRQRFLKGPIPVGQIAAISQLPGKAFVLWLLIRHRIDLTGKPKVTLPSELLRECGIGKDAKADGLRRLAEAGEVEVEYRPGHSASVSLRYPRKRRRR